MRSGLLVFKDFVHAHHDGGTAERLKIAGGRFNCDILRMEQAELTVNRLALSQRQADSALARFCL